MAQAKTGSSKGGTTKPAAAPARRSSKKKTQVERIFGSIRLGQKCVDKVLAFVGTNVDREKNDANKAALAGMAEALREGDFEAALTACSGLAEKGYEPPVKNIPKDRLGVGATVDVADESLTEYTEIFGCAPADLKGIKVAAIVGKRLVLQLRNGNRIPAPRTHLKLVAS